MSNDLSPADFELISRLALDRAAIVLESGKEYLVSSRLGKLAREEGFADASGLCDAVRRERSRGPITTKVIEAMTTNETLFFRDARPFDALRKVVVPELMEARRTSKSLTVWSLACSTGQEPYSIAMLLREHFPELANWRVKIVAADLSTEVLAKAAEGVFNQLEVNRGLPAPMMVRYFDRQGTQFRIKSEIRSMVDFRPINLAERIMLSPKPDVVFLRNVMIYFDVSTRERILREVGAQMAPDGYLFLGAGETTLNLDVPFDRIDLERTNCFRPRGVGSRAITPKEESWNRPSTTFAR